MNDIKLKCRNCEHIIVEKVNADYSRGRGWCSGKYNKNGYWPGRDRVRYFSDPICLQYEERHSTHKKGAGDGRKEIFRQEGFD